MKKIIPVIACLWCFCACTSSQQRDTIKIVQQPVKIDSLESSCPHFSKDAQGNIVLSWIRETNDTDCVVCYAVSKDGGRSFGAAVVIPSSKGVFPHGENMPKVIFKPDGTVFAAWGIKNPSPENPYSGLVYYAQSYDDGETWSAPEPLTKDPESTDQRYFDLTLLPDGEIGIVWLDNRSKTEQEGSTLFFEATNGKNGFREEVAIGATCCPCCRTCLFTDNRQEVHVVFRDIINDSIRDMVHIVSADNGKTFSAPVRISNDNWVINGCPHTGPAMTQNKNGLQFAWYTGGDKGGVFYCHSDDDGKTYSLRDSVRSSPGARHPQIASLDNDDAVIVWDEAVQRHSVIGLQVRDTAGRQLATRYLSDEQLYSTFPVVTPTASNGIVIAYTTKDARKKSYVYYEIAGIK